MNPSTTDDELAEQAKAGNRPALDCLMHRHYAAMLRILSSRYGQDAEDMLHSGLVEAVLKLESFRGGNFRAWCLRIIVNRSISDNRRKRPQPIDDEMIRTTVVAPQDDLERWRLREKEDETLSPCLRELSAIERTVIAAKYGNDISVRALADMFGISERRIHKMRCEAIKKLRQCAEKTLGNRS